MVVKRYSFLNTTWRSIESLREWKFREMMLLTHPEPLRTLHPVLDTLVLRLDDAVRPIGVAQGVFVLHGAGGPGSIGRVDQERVPWTMRWDDGGPPPHGTPRDGAEGG